MADKSTQLILDALRRAAAEPDGAPLHGTRSAPGLFPANAAAKAAAQRCRDDGLVRLIGTETRGKTIHEIYAITEKGLAYLLREVNPRHVLEDFVRALDARQAQLGQMAESLERAQASIAALKAAAEQVLRQLASTAATPPPAAHYGNGAVANGSPASCTGDVLDRLRQWHASGASEDCSLPELYRHARAKDARLTIGQFHDALRRLHQEQKVYLHPWTGPLYELPEPPLALLIGHEIVYYASLR